MKKTIALSIAVLTAVTIAGCAPRPVDEAVQEEVQVTATTESTAAAEVDESAAAVTEAEQAEDLAVTGALETGPATLDQTTELLVFLIEEEKLAHDVYTVLYEEYGSKVFGNILESESTHQDQVLGLLDQYDVEDPRSSEIGVFNDPALQALYDQLIEKGMTSAQDAFEVGVMIEEKDIADITFQLAGASDPDVIEVLEKLRSGSENHLRAFNRQL
jgi:hypothetical protein